MKLVKSDESRNEGLGDPFSRLWKDFFQAPFPSPRIKSPVIDVSEDEQELTVKAEIAGMSEKDLELSWLDGVLYIKGEKKDEKEEKSRKNTWHRESWYGSFTRGIPLGAGADFANARAEYRNGVVTVHIPKVRTAAKANTIAIQQGGKA